jgi:deoxyadenosine/deoxycytidine kinase
MKKFMVIAGNIGAGKSSLAGLLGARLGWKPYYEPVNENPYLTDFYKNMEAWSFHSQVFFLVNRLRMLKQLLDDPASVIQDRSVYEDALIFAQNLYRRGLISKRDYKTYQELYQVLTEFLPPPDLVVYLKASPNTLFHRIVHRGRDYEKTIDIGYLTQLNQLYEEWIASFCLCPVLTVPADDLDYVAHPAHLDLIVTKILEKLTGKEEVVFQPEEVARLR